MNQRLEFRPSHQFIGPTTKSVTNSDADLSEEAALIEPATKAADFLSEEERALNEKLAGDATAGLSRLRINGICVRIGLEWQPGGEELWDAK